MGDGGLMGEHLYRGKGVGCWVRTFLAAKGREARAVVGWGGAGLVEG